VSQPVLEAAGLTVSLGGRRIIDVSSFTVVEHEVMVIIGPNGSGKTTLLQTLALLIRPTGGELRGFGQPVTPALVLPTRRRLAVVFQEPLLLSTTVANNVSIGLRFRGVKRQDAGQRVKRWLERFGVGHLAQRQARTLSGGEAQRVSLARAFALEPEILFMDEPFAALDAPTRQTLTEDFQKVLRETRTTTVMVTHDRNEALMLADRVAVIMEGQVRQVGRPADVFNSPADETIAAFVGVENILPGTVTAQNTGVAEVSLAGATISASNNLPVGSKVTALLRPEDVTLALPQPSTASSSARNRLAGVVARVTPLGSQVRVTVECGVAVVALVTRRSYEELGLDAGVAVVVSFKASSVHLLPLR